MVSDFVFIAAANVRYGGSYSYICVQTIKTIDSKNMISCAECKYMNTTPSPII